MNQILSVLLKGPFFLKFLYPCICDIFTKCFSKQFATMYMITRWTIVACLRASYTICRWFAFFWTVDAKITRLTFYKYMTVMIKIIRKHLHLACFKMSLLFLGQTMLEIPGWWFYMLAICRRAVEWQNKVPA